MKHEFSINSSSGLSEDGLVIYIKCQSLYNLILNSLFSSFYLPTPFPKGFLSYIVFSIASQSSTCTSKGNNLDACPIKTLLEVVESVVSCGITVQVSFPHKCS